MEMEEKVTKKIQELDQKLSLIIKTQEDEFVKKIDSRDTRLLTFLYKEYSMYYFAKKQLESLLID